MTDARCEPPSELRGKDGWHWVVWTPTGETEPYNPVAIWWDAEALGWCPDLPKCADTRELTEYRYLSPVLTPAEVAALRAERDAAVAENHKLKTGNKLLADTVRSWGWENRKQESNGELIGRALWEQHDALTTLRAEAEKMKRALKAADQFITNGIELGFIRMPDPSTPDPALETPGIIRAALKETAP